MGTPSFLTDSLILSDIREVFEAVALHLKHPLGIFHREVAHIGEVGEIDEVGDSGSLGCWTLLAKLLRFDRLLYLWDQLQSVSEVYWDGVKLLKFSIVTALLILLTEQPI